MASDHPATTFVQADPSTFRAVVQRLTGATTTTAPPEKPPTETPRRRPGFNLHERRQTAGKLEITLNNHRPFAVMSPAARHRSFAGEMMMSSSPVSTLDVYGYGRGSPRTPVEEEERAIAEKGFYLHRSPMGTPRGSEPELLVLFPLCSPKTDPSCSSS